MFIEKAKIYNNIEEARQDWHRIEKEKAKIVLNCCVCDSNDAFFDISSDKPYCKTCALETGINGNFEVRKKNPGSFLKYCGVSGIETKYSFDFYKENFKYLDYLKKYPYQKKLNNLFIIGDPDRGKTGLAISIMAELIKRGVDYNKMYYFVENKLIQEFLVKQNDWLDSKEFKAKLYNRELLIIDEVGYKAPGKTNFSGNILKELVDEFHSKQKTLILISNLGYKELTPLYGHALISRLKTFKKCAIKNEGFRKKTPQARYN